MFGFIGFELIVVGFVGEEDVEVLVGVFVLGCFVVIVVLEFVFVCVFV